jgi:hypothetical protein
MGAHIYLSPMWLTLLFFVSLNTACAPKHYTQMHKDSISLYYQNKEAKEVLFASSIDHYRLHPASRREGGTWEVVVPRAREFSYFYLVDKTLTIPDCQAKVLDDFGAKNCLFVSDR